MNLMDTAEFLEIECPKCAAEYRILLKYCGENALCDKCGVLFAPYLLLKNLLMQKTSMFQKVLLECFPLTSP